MGSVGCSVDWRGSFIYWRSHGSFLANVKRRIVSFFEYLISRKTGKYWRKVDDWRIFSFLTNWKIPFEDINYSNNSEVALFYHFFSNCIPSKSICVIWQKDSEQKLLGRILMIFVCFLSFGLPLGCQNG